MRSLLFGGRGGGDALADLGLLGLRLLVGLGLALAHGVHMIPPSSDFITGVGQLGFPQPALFAWAAALAELGGGLLLALGLLTRPAALAIAFTMAVAFFRSLAGQPFGERELAALYGAAAVVFLFAGAGRFSFDRLIKK